METTKEMERILRLVIEKEIAETYPQSPPATRFKTRILEATMNTLLARPEDYLSKAFRMAVEEQTQ